MREREHYARLMDVVDRAYKNHLKSANKAEELVTSGDVKTGLEMLAKQGQWDQCLALASKSGNDTLIRYLFGYVKKLASEGSIALAIKYLHDYNCPPVNSQ